MVADEEPATVVGADEGPPGALDSDGLLRELTAAFEALTDAQGPRVSVVRVLAETGHGKTYAVQRLHDRLARQHGGGFYPPVLASDTLPSTDEELRRRRRQVTSIGLDAGELDTERGYTWVGVACGQNRAGSADDDLHELIKQMDLHRRLDFSSKGRAARAGAKVRPALRGASELATSGLETLLPYLSSALKLVEGTLDAVEELRSDGGQDLAGLTLEQAKEQVEQVQDLFSEMLDPRIPTVVVVDDAHNASPGLTLGLELLVRTATQPHAVEWAGAGPRSTPHRPVNPAPLLVPRCPLLIVTTEWTHLAELPGGEGTAFRQWIDRLIAEQPYLTATALDAGQLSRTRAADLLRAHELPDRLVGELLAPFSEDGVNAYALAERLRLLLEQVDGPEDLEDEVMVDWLCANVAPGLPTSPQDTVRQWFERLDRPAQEAIRLGARLGRSFPVELVAQGKAETAAALDRAVVEFGLIQPGVGHDAGPQTEAWLLRTVVLNDLASRWLSDQNVGDHGQTHPRLLKAVTRFVRAHLSQVTTQPVRSVEPLFFGQRIARLERLWSLVASAERTPPDLAVTCGWLTGHVTAEQLLAKVRSTDGDATELLAAALLRHRPDDPGWDALVTEASHRIAGAGTGGSTLWLILQHLRPDEGAVAELVALADVPGWAGVHATSALVAAGQLTLATEAFHTRITTHGSAWLEIGRAHV